MERVILVDKSDNEVGLKEKLLAHKDGDLHRAFSVYVLKEGKMLLQKRADVKYHSPGLWTNTACGHPRLGESVEDAATRRLKEELGMTATLIPLTTLVYKADVGGGLTEHEFLHVFIGKHPSETDLNPDEVSTVKWVKIADLQTDMQENSDQYTAWFKLILPQIIEMIK